MKKFISAVLAIATLATSFAFVGCNRGSAEGEVETPADFVAPYSEYDLTEYIKLADYKAAEYTPLSTEVTPNALRERINAELEEYATLEIVEDRGAIMGDTLVINYFGTVDGEPLENGSATEQNITLGEGQYIEGFEEGLVGAKTGETVKLNLTFPDPYPNNTELSGKAVEFTVLVRYIKGKVMPDLTDEFVQKISEGKYSTVTEYADSFSLILQEELNEKAEEQKKIDACGAYLTACEVIKLPEKEIEEYITGMTEYYDSVAKQYGITRFELLGVDEASYDTIARQKVETQVKQEVMLYAIVQKEGLILTQAEFDAVVNEVAEQSDMTAEEVLKQYDFIEFYSSAMYDKAMAFVASKATAVEAKETTATIETAVTE